MACASAADTCGDDKDMCCGLASKGVVMKDATTPSTTIMTNSVSICNKKPVNGKSAAEEFKGTIQGLDTAVMFSYPADDFACWAAAPPPGPVNPPKPDPPADANIGKACSKATDKCGNADGKTDYCCGIASGGKVLDKTGKTPTGANAPNIVICNKNAAGDAKAVDFEDYYEANGVLVSAIYKGDNFTCLSGAKALAASAAALFAVVSMI